VTTAEILTVTPDPGVPDGTDDAGGAASALARLFQRAGLPVRGRRVVAADEGETERALRQAVAEGGLVVCLGDGDGAEAVRQALARLVGSRLVLSDRVMDAVAAAYAERGQAMPRRAEGLALVPQGTSVLLAPGGGEPGLLAEVGGALVAVLPADRRAAVALAEAQVLPRVGRRGAEPVSVVRTLRLVGLEPAEVEARLGPLLRAEDGASARALEVGSEVWVRLRLRGPTRAAADASLGGLEPALRRELGAAWYGTDDETLEQAVGRLLRIRNLTVALAESCTGGLAGHRLTDVPGSSAYIERGFVVYSNAAKQTLLGVPEPLIGRFGAVSAECADAMARGARERAGSDLGLSVTGIAGPDGGTPTKPVGLVFIALADARAVTVQRFRFDRDRQGNKALAATMALDLLRRYCLDAPAVTKR
jgi:nicotinamide-nucleotide amidase